MGNMVVLERQRLDILVKEKVQSKTVRGMLNIAGWGEVIIIEMLGCEVKTKKKKVVTIISEQSNVI